MNNFQLATKKLEEAIAEFVAAAREGEAQQYVTQYVLIIASEAMEDSNSTYFTYGATASTPKYQLRGLLTEAMHHYRSDIR